MSYTIDTLRGTLGPEAAARQLRQQQEVFGPKYHKGLDMGTVAKFVLENVRRIVLEDGSIVIEDEGEKKKFVPPIFSVKQDEGELAGFNTIFGVGPFQPLSATIDVISGSYGVKVVQFAVTNKEDLTPREGFMVDRMPAVRLICVPKVDQQG